MRSTVKGNRVPEAGDSLLETWPESLDTLGTIGRYDSLTAMRAAIARAAAMRGAAPTSTMPWYGDVQGRIWRADGSKDSSGQYVLTPLFEVTFEGASGWTPINSGGVITDQQLIVKTGTVSNYTKDHKFGNGYMPTTYFSKPFPNRLMTIQITPFYNNGSGGWTMTDWNPPHVDQASRESFRVMYVGEKETKAHSFMWLAIGS